MIIHKIIFQNLMIFKTWRYKILMHIFMLYIVEPKSNVRFFLWMKATNFNSTWWPNYWWHGDSMALKNLLLMCFCLWCVLLLCKLWWKEFSELVSVMERNPYYSIKTLLEFYASHFCKEIGKKIFAQRRDEVMRSIFDAG